MIRKFVHITSLLSGLLMSTVSFHAATAAEPLDPDRFTPRIYGEMVAHSPDARRLAHIPRTVTLSQPAHSLTSNVQTVSTVIDVIEPSEPNVLRIASAAQTSKLDPDRFKPKIYGQTNEGLAPLQSHNVMIKRAPIAAMTVSAAPKPQGITYGDARPTPINTTQTPAHSPVFVSKRSSDPIIYGGNPIETRYVARETVVAAPPPTNTLENDTSQPLNLYDAAVKSAGVGRPVVSVHHERPHRSVNSSSHHDDGPTRMDAAAKPVTFDTSLFGSDPVYPTLRYDSSAQLEIYGGKSPVISPRPLLEIGRDLYSSGELHEGYNLIGEKNRLYPQLLVYGDARTAVAYNSNRGKEVGQIAARLNLDVDLKLTATERFHAFFRPIDNGKQFSRYEFAGNAKNPSADPDIVLDFEPVTAFFEGDLGAIMAGLTDEYKPYDLPFTFGRVPLLMQNGVWIEDAFLGAAVAIPAKNSSKFDISNFDITFFAGFDEITSDAFLNSVGGKDDHDAKMVGAAGFFEFDEGYMETGYAYVHDRDKSDGDYSYHNATVAFTKRYGGKISNSTRVIANFGQNPGGGRDKTADGVLFLSENSLVTHKPLTLVPYANFWAGFGSTQSLARAGGAGGVLRNTGLNFESDGLTGFPTIDAKAIDTFGGALGIQNLFNLEQQLVGEIAVVVPHSKDSPVKKTQVAAGVRYQRPLNKAVIVRLDAMYGLFGDGKDSAGIRMEIRRKF